MLKNVRFIHIIQAELLMVRYIKKKRRFENFACYAKTKREQVIFSVWKIDALFTCMGRDNEMSPIKRYEDNTLSLCEEPEEWEDETPYEKISSKLRIVDGKAHCPVHDREGKGNRRLNVFKANDGTVLLHCDWGCKVDSIVKAIGLKMSDLSPKSDLEGLWACQLYTLKDAYAPREPLQFIVSGLLTLPSLSIVYGAPGTMKSLLLADAAVCVAAGIPWLSRDVIQAPIMWIDFDNGSRRTHERFEALARARNLPEDAPLNYVSMPEPWLNAGNMANIEGLISTIKELGIKLVCIDNLGLISPSSDENSDEMVAVMGNLRLLAERTGAAVVIIHHQRKGQSNGKSRAGDSLRGHSSIEGAIDLALLVNRKGSEESITVSSTKTRDVEVQPFGATFRYEHKTDTKELDIAYFDADKSLHQAIEKAILEINEKRPDLGQEKTIELVRENSQATVRAVRDVYKRLSNSGQILKQKNKRV